MAELPFPLIGPGPGNRVAFNEAFTVGSDVCAISPNTEAASEATALFGSVAKLEKKEMTNKKIRLQPESTRENQPITAPIVRICRQAGEKGK